MLTYYNVPLTINIKALLIAESKPQNQHINVQQLNMDKCRYLFSLYPTSKTCQYKCKVCVISLE